MKNRILKIGAWCVFTAIMLITPVKDDIQAQSNTVDMKTAKDTAHLPNAGWLIFDGELIPGPYDIVIEDDCIKVNGRSHLARVKQPKPPKPTHKTPYDSKALTEIGTINLIQDSFPVWRTQVGSEHAQTRALAMANMVETVDSADFISETAMKIIFHRTPEPIPYIIMLNPDVARDSHSLEETHWGILQNRAQSLRGWLSNGNLVILQDVQGLYVINSMKARETLEKLRAIVTSTPDMDTRIAAVRKIIHDDRMAKAIAERLE